MTTAVNSTLSLTIGLLVKHPNEPGAILSAFDPKEVNLDLMHKSSEHPHHSENETKGIDASDFLMMNPALYSKCMNRPFEILDTLEEDAHMHEILEGPESLPTQLHWSHHLPSLTNLIIPPSELAYFQQLRCLNLSSNALTSLPLSIFTLIQLSELNLGYNQLVTLSPLIGCLSDLEELYLNGNQLTKLPSTLSLCKRLKILDISDNYLSWLPAGLVVTTQLRKLWINHNRFYEAFINPVVIAPSFFLYQPLSSPPRLLQLALQVVAKHLKVLGPHAYCRHAPNTRFTTAMNKHLLHQLHSSDVFSKASRRSLEQVLMGLLHAEPLDPSLLPQYFYGLHPTSSTSMTSSLPRSLVVHASTSVPPLPKSSIPPPIQTHLFWGISAAAPVLSPQIPSPLSTSSIPSPPSAYQHYCLFQILSSPMLWSLFLTQGLCSCCQGGIHLIPSLETPLLFGTVHTCPNDQWLPIVHELCSIACWNKVTHHLWRKIKRVKPS
ncbi:hypothetical protein HMI55_006344 [Coelomomyces lativittatus]|nr:hypothetical protein HMI55_006344 [Coelomomyces lativittatus]